MNGGRITLTTSEQRRLIVLNHLESGALVNAEAARLLDLSVRQLQRMKAAYAEVGAAALSHGNRGRRPMHALAPELARMVVGDHDLRRFQLSAPDRASCRGARAGHIQAQRPSHPHRGWRPGAAYAETASASTPASYSVPTDYVGLWRAASATRCARCACGRRSRSGRRSLVRASATAGTQRLAGELADILSLERRWGREALIAAIPRGSGSGASRPGPTFDIGHQRVHAANSERWTCLCSPGCDRVVVDWLSLCAM
jgi:hypothetical protein